MNPRSVTQTAVEKGQSSTMSNPLTEDYLRWLAPQIREAQSGNPIREYWDLLAIMSQKKFDWFVPNDDNRIEDGKALRVEFCYAQHIRPDALRNLGPCSFLEVLVGLSRRLAFVAGGSAPGWAWTLITNLELNRMSDPISGRSARKANDILDRCIRRDYTPDGQGGFFPLAWPNEDQTQVELWYQMAAFIDELHPERG